MSYDPTQPVSPPIEPTQREDDLIPPPPPPVPIDVRELPNFKVKDPPPRKTIAALSVLTVLVVSAAV